MRSVNAGKDWQTPHCSCADEGIGNSVAILKSRLTTPRNTKHETAVTHNCRFEHSLGVRQLVFTQKLIPECAYEPHV